MGLGIALSLLGMLLLSLSYRPGIRLRYQNVLFIFGVLLVFAGGVSLGPSFATKP